MIGDDATVHVFARRPGQQACAGHGERSAEVAIFANSAADAL